MSKSFWWLVIVLVLVAVGGFYLRYNDNGDQLASENNLPTDGNEELIPATGNIDDVVEAIMGELNASYLAPEESNSGLVNFDESVVDEVDQSLGDSQF